MKNEQSFKIEMKLCRTSPTIMRKRERVRESVWYEEKNDGKFVKILIRIQLIIVLFWAPLAIQKRQIEW